MQSKYKTPNIPLDLLAKYDKIGPRYTSYPTAPEWVESFSGQQWLEAVERSNESGRDVSLYFHIPFCQSACYYCACNIVISPKSVLSEPYIQALTKEIELVGKLIDSKRKIKQLHFGGGTPTYLTADQLKYLFDKISQHFNLDFSEDSEYSIEIDPRVTSFEQLKLLRELGFNRVSLGVQDFDAKVQTAVNRIQSYEMISDMLSYCRAIGYQSINFDLIYGLPFQTLESFEETLEKVIQLNPDRIALFNYAHIPSLRPFQKANIKQEDLPSREIKIAIFCKALQVFSENGYEYIGMDHFAKSNDELFRARLDRTLHRNFQGYTTKAGCDLFGLGMTSISSIDNTYSQNEKKLNRYLDFFGKPDYTASPIERGLECSADDLIRKSIINKFLCHGLLIFSEIENEFKFEFREISFKEYFANELNNLKELESDKLIELSDSEIRVTDLGRVFLRNIGMVFDAYLQKNSQRLFSRTV